MSDQGVDQPGGEENFWAKAVKKESSKAKAAKKAARPSEPAPEESWTSDPDERRARKTRVIRRVLLISGGSLLLLFIILLLMLPTIAGWIVPGSVKSAFADKIVGEVEAQEVSLSWGGPQKVGKLIVSEGGSRVVEVQVSADISLWSLIRGNYALGDVNVTGDVTLVRAKDGTLNLERALKKSPKAPPPSVDPASIPASLSADVNIKGIDISIRDEAVGESSRVKVKKLAGTIQVGAGKAAKVKLSATVDAGTGAPTGTIAIEGKVTKWCDDAGLITTKKLGAELAIGLERVPSRLIETLGGKRGLERGLGPSVDGTIGLTWDAGAGQVKTLVNSDGVKANLDATIRESMLSLASDASVTLSPAMIGALNPEMSKRLVGGEVVSLESLPGVRLTIQRMSLPMPKGPDIEVGEMSCDMTLTIDASKGTIRVDPAGPPKPIVTTPIVLNASGTKLSQGLRITATGEANVSAQRAGVLAVDLTASGLLGRYGDVKFEGANIEGKAEIKGVASSLVQGVVGDVGIDFVRDVGPTLDVSVGAQRAGASGEPTARFEVSAEKLKGSAAVALRKDEIAIVAPGADVRFSGVGGMLATKLPASSGWVGRGDGELVLRIESLTLPRDQAGGAGGAGGSKDAPPLVARTEMNATLTLSGATFDPNASDGASSGAATSGRTTKLKDLAAKITLKPGSPATIGVSGGGTMGDAPISIAGELRTRIEKLIEPQALRPRLAAGAIKGSLTLKGVPTGMAGMFGADAARAAAAINHAMGESADVTVEIGTSDTALTLKTDLKMARGEVNVQAGVADGKLRIGTMAVRGEVPPDRWAALLRELNVKGTGELNPVSPVAWTLSVNPMTMPVDDDLKPRPSADEPITMTASLPTASRWRVQPIGGTAREVTIDPGILTMAAAPTAVVGAGGLVKINGSGSVKADTGQRLGSVQVAASITLASSVLNGPIEMTVTIGGLDTAIAGAAMGDARGMEAIIGNSLDADVTLAASLAPGPGGATKIDRLSASFAGRGSRLSTEQPIKLGIQGTNIVLDSPAQISISPDAAWLTSVLNTPAGGAHGSGGSSGASNTATNGGAMRVDSISPVVIKLTRLTMPAMLEPGVGMMPRSLDAEVSVQNCALASAQQGTIRLAGASVKLTYAEPTRMRVVVACDEAQVGDKPATRGVKLNASIENGVDNAGNLTLGRAAFSGQGSLPVIPTAMVESMLGTTGLLGEVLGPTASLTLTQGEYDAATGQGQIDATFTSSRSSAKVAGRFDRAALKTTGPMQVTVSEVTPGLSAYLAGKQPVFAVVQKQPTDQPLMFSARSASAPLAGDMTLLDGDFTLELGEARVGLAPGIAKLIKPLSGGAGAVKVVSYPALMFTARRGVVTVQPWLFPMDEFTFQTQGTIDLVKRQVDILTWVPAGALTAETVGAFQSQLSAATGKTFGGIDPKLQVPLRTRGPMDSPTTKVELDAAAMDELKRLAGKVLEDQIKDQVIGKIKEQIPGLGPTPPGGAPTTPTTPKPPG